MIELATRNGEVAPAQPSDVLRKGYLPRELDRSDLQVHILKFPLGDIDNFSVARHAYAMSQQRYYGKSEGHYRRLASWETKYLDALSGLSEKAQGEYVTGQDGGYLAPEAWSQRWSDVLRAFSVVDPLPMTRLYLPYRIAHLAKVSSDVTISYPGENTSIPATQFQFGQLSYTARKQSATIGVSNELMRDAPFLADQVLRQSTGRALASDRDLQILMGQGGPNPAGLVTLATNGTIAKYYPGGTPSGAILTTANHAIPSFFHVSQLRGKVHRLNGSTNAPSTGQAHCNGMIVHSRFEQDVMTQGGTNGPWTDANGRPLWMQGLSTPATAIDEDKAAEGALLGQIWVLSNILPTTSTDGGGTASSFVIAGWWEQFALFQATQVAYDTTMEASYFQNDQTGVKVLNRWDAGPIHPEAFAVMAGCDSVTP